MPTFPIESFVRDYHIYKATRSVSVGEIVFIERKEMNMKDSFAVSVVRKDVIVGRVQSKISCVCSIYLRRGGIISCMVKWRDTQIICPKEG